MKKLDALALALAIVGALNWGLVALAEFDLVAKIAGLEFGQTNGFTRDLWPRRPFGGVPRRSLRRAGGT